MTEEPKLLLIGSMTHSFPVYDDGIRERFGGGVAYGGRTAGVLKVPTSVITIGAEDIEPGIEEIRAYGIDVRRIEREVSNNFSNDYRGTKRQLRMPAYITEPISKDDFKDAPDCNGVIFFPGFHEISGGTMDIFKNKIIFLDVAGLTREIGEKDEDGLYLVNQAHWDAIDDFRNKVDVLKVSHEDLENIKFVGNIKTDEEKIQNLAENGFPMVLFTKGEKSTVLAQRGKKLVEVPTFSCEGDAAGAGEVFSVGFMAEYLSTKDAVYATAFANACASFKIAGEDYNYDKAKSRAGEILKSLV